MNNEEIVINIQKQISNSLLEIEENLALWLKEHIIYPHLITITKGEVHDTFWLVTDNTGKKDSSYRIVYSPNEDMFGLIMRTLDGSDSFLGFYGNFKETIVNM